MKSPQAPNRSECWLRRHSAQQLLYRTTHGGLGQLSDTYATGTKYANMMPTRYPRQYSPARTWRQQLGVLCPLASGLASSEGQARSFSQNSVPLTASLSSLSFLSLLRMLKNSTPGLKDKVPPSGEEKAAATYHFAHLSPLWHTTLRVWLIYSFPPPCQHCAGHTAPGHSPPRRLHCLLG